MVFQVLPQPEVHHSARFPAASTGVDLCSLFFIFAVQVDGKCDILLLFLFFIKIVLFFFFFNIQPSMEQELLLPWSLFVFEWEIFSKTLSVPPPQVASKGHEAAMMVSGTPWLTPWC